MATDLGINKGSSCKGCSWFPQLLGCSVEQNMKPKYVLLLHTFGVEEIASMISRRPQILGYSMTRLIERMHILSDRNLTAKLPSVMDLTEANFQRRFGD